MQFSNMSMASLVMVLLSVSASASSMNARDSGSSGSSGSLTVAQAAQQCGNGQTISCCNTSTDDSGSGLDALNGLLGGSCTAIPINVIGVQVPINQACAGNQAACCTGSQSGLVNVQCTPVNV